MPYMYGVCGGHACNDMHAVYMNYILCRYLLCMQEYTVYMNYIMYRYVLYMQEYTVCVCVRYIYCILCMYGIHIRHTYKAYI